MLELMPHGYTNRTVRAGAVVIKSYQGPGAAARCAREAAVLTALTGRTAYCSTRGPAR